MPTILPLVIPDSHKHVGSMPSLHLATDRDALRALTCEQGNVRHRDSRSILGHMGHRNTVHTDAAIAVAPRNPDVVLETPGMPLHATVRETVERTGPDRAVDGSDAPFHHPVVALAKVRACGLPQDLADRAIGEGGLRPFFGDGMPGAVA